MKSFCDGIVRLLLRERRRPRAGRRRARRRFAGSGDRRRGRRGRAASSVARRRAAPRPAATFGSHSFAIFAASALRSPASRSSGTPTTAVGTTGSASAARPISTSTSTKSISSIPRPPMCLGHEQARARRSRRASPRIPASGPSACPTGRARTRRDTPRRGSRARSVAAGAGLRVNSNCMSSSRSPAAGPNAACRGCARR